MPDQPQAQGQLLPWQTGTFQPWMQGQSFMGADGAIYQAYPDPASSTGWTIKRTDQAGTSFQVGPSPSDPYAGAQAFEASPYGQRLKAAEEAQAAQNAWNQKFQTTGQNNTHQYQMGQLGVQQGQLGVSQAAQKSTAEYQKGLLEQARQQLEVQKTGQQLQTGYQTLDLGSRLRGERDYFQYQQMAAGASGNPLIAGAVQTWANMSNNRPTGGGAWAGGTPQPMTVGALTSDMGAATPGGQMNAAGNAVTDQGGQQTGGAYQPPTIAAFDEFLMNPHQSAPNYLATLDKGQLGALQSYSDIKGHNWGTVESRYNNSRLKQKTAGSRAA